MTARSTAGSVNAADYGQSTYDAAGNRTGWRKRDGRTFNFAFDALEAMVRKGGSWPGPLASAVSL